MKTKTSKLTKEQRAMLQTAVDSFEAHGSHKPIHCDIGRRETIDEYSKSYATYNKQMYKLLDAGLIAAPKNDRVGTLTYIADYDVARKALADGFFTLKGE